VSARTRGWRGSWGGAQGATHLTALPKRPPTCSESAKSTWSWTSSSRPVGLGARLAVIASSSPEAVDCEVLASGQIARLAFDGEPSGVEAGWELVGAELPGDGGKALGAVELAEGCLELPVLVLAALELLGEKLTVVRAASSSRERPAAARCWPDWVRRPPMARVRKRRAGARLI
jgi:hypothetical protein